MKTNIALFGLAGIDKPAIVERFDGSLDELKKRLLELQAGFCESEKPKLSTEERNGKSYFEAYSDSDFSHVARFK
jgi:hypothetical protein